MKKHLAAIALGFVLCALESSPLYAQSPTAGDSAAVVEASLIFAKQHMGVQEKLYLDASAGAKAGMHDNASRGRLAALIGAQIAKREEVETCANGVCTMAPGTALVTVSHVSITGDSATVDLDVSRPSGFKRVPIAFVGRTYQSVRRGGRWIVLRGDVTTRS